MKIPSGPPDPTPLTGHLPHATLGQRVEAWFEFMEAHDRFTRNWFAERIERGQDLDEVLREYYRRKFDEHESFAVAIAKGHQRRATEAARPENTDKHVE